MNKKIFTVSETNKYIRMLIERDFLLADINVSGEISTLTKHSSGHYYFSLKDNESEASCVMFRGEVQNLDFNLKNGDKVIVTGRVSVYESRGRYQIYVKKIQKFGLGEMYIKLEKLKKKLELEGLFDKSHKKLLPKYPNTIGIVTSAVGAAIKDIVKIAHERNDSVSLKLYDSLVQGENAKETLIKGLKYFDEECDVDIIIIGRGGGSFEDLMAFNDEGLARAIFNAKTPIISAVGHERDFSISDLVCDVRGATPSDAAILAIPNKEELRNSLVNYNFVLNSKLKDIIRKKDDELTLLSSKINLLSPRSKLDIFQHTLIEKSNTINNLFERTLIRKSTELNTLSAKLESIHPLNNLKNGYSYIYKGDDHVMSVNALKSGDTISINMYDGEILATVVEVNISDEKK